MVKDKKEIKEYPFPEGSCELGFIPKRTITLPDGTIVIEDMEMLHIAVVDTSKPIKKRNIRNFFIKRFKSLFSFLRL